MYNSVIFLAFELFCEKGLLSIFEAFCVISYTQLQLLYVCSLCSHWYRLIPILLNGMKYSAMDMALLKVCLVN